MESAEGNTTYEILRLLIASNGTLTNEIVKLMDEELMDAGDLAASGSSEVSSIALQTDPFIMLHIVIYCLLLLVSCCVGFFCGVFSFGRLLPSDGSAKNLFYIVQRNVDIEQARALVEQPSPPPPYPCSESTDSEIESETASECGSTDSEPSDGYTVVRLQFDH